MLFSIVKRLFAPLLLLCVCGCSSRLTKHGDAIWRRPPLLYIGGVVPDYLLLPEIPLSQRAVFRFGVRDLPHPLYLSYLKRRTPEQFIMGEGHSSRLANFTVQIAFCRVDGQEIFSYRIQPGNDGFGGFYIDGNDRNAYSHLEIPLSDGLPLLRSYDVVLEVIEPSPNSDDSAHLEGVWMGLE